MAFGLRRNRLAIGDAWPVRGDLDRVAILHAFESQFEVQVGEAADDGFVEFLVVLYAEARIFLTESGQGVGQFLLLTLVRRFDGEAEHRLRKIERFEVDLILIM